MDVRNGLKQKIFIMFAVIAVSFSSLGMTIALADEASDKVKITKGVDDYVGDDAEDVTDLLEKFNKEDQKEARKKRDSFTYVLSRVLGKGYVNNTSDGVLAKASKSNPMDADGYVCDPNEPNNLLNHNCNVPTFATELLQATASLKSDTPIIGAERKSAKSATKLGVPKVPGGEVPVNPESRSERYTALELFGYDLTLTSYTGEWDHIQKSSTSRLLSNMGPMESVKAIGSSIWAGAKSGLGALVTDFSFNPIRWATNVMSAASSGTFNSIIDTHELNVIAGNLWRREDFDKTLYNVYVLTDDEVVRESAFRYMSNYSNRLTKAVNDSEELNTVMKLESIPEFKFDPQRETEESIKARKEVEALNKTLQKEAEENNRTPYLQEVPEPVLMTESEQLEEWAEENKEILELAKSKGLIKSLEELEKYDEIEEYWEAQWDSYSQKAFSANQDIIKNIQKEIDEDVFKNDPFSDPKQPISHYVCADSNGNPIRSEDGSYEYLYTDYNSDGKEHLNPNCKVEVRKPISSGLYGSGWHIDRPADTRHVSNFNPGVKFGTSVANFMLKVNAFIAKVVNTVIDLSFNPILESLGITDIVEIVMSSFRDTIFFPLSVIIAVFGGVMLFLRVLQNGSAKHLIVSAFSIVLVFIIGTAFLFAPGRTVGMVEKVPHAIDRLIIDSLLYENEGGGMCDVGGERTAQCNVWSVMVFQPWVNAQFGDSYDTLYAAGHAPAGSEAMRNTNSNLVGNAEVDMGGGTVVNNWALYQLSLMKSGTITTEDKSKPLGVVDKDMYKIVDMQAGPDNGAGVDSRLLSNWSGDEGSRFGTVFLGTIQSLFLAAAVLPLGMMKIELSFVFAIWLLMLPIVLLKALTPQGVMEFPNYLAKMAGLFLQRIVVAMMLAVMLLITNSVHGAGASYAASAMMISAISYAFIMFRKEILKLFNVGSSSGVMGGELDAIKGALGNAVPKHVRNRASVAAERTKGRVGGFIGGALYGLKNNEEHYVDDKGEFVIKKENRLKSMFSHASQASEEAANIAGNRADRALLRTGHSALDVYSQGKAKKLDKVSRDIINDKKALEGDIFREASTASKFGTDYRSSKSDFSRDDLELLKNPKVQKAIRDEAQRRRRAIKSGEVTDEFDVDKVAKVIDSERAKMLRNEMLRDPLQAVSKMHDQTEKAINREKSDIIKSDVETRMKHAEEEYDKKLSEMDVEDIDEDKGDEHEE